MFQKFFNIAGPCVPQEHYMLPASERLSDIQSLIEQRLYFVIHAARQSGKTTLLKDLTRTLNATGAYYALYCSLESVQEIADPEKGMPALVDQVRSAVKYSPVLAARPFGKTVDRSNYSTMLKESVTDFCAGLDKPLIVLFDEADCLSNGTLISFLRQLREGYINRSDTPFIHSLALVLRHI